MYINNIVILSYSPHNIKTCNGRRFTGVFQMSHMFLEFVKKRHSIYPVSFPVTRVHNCGVRDLSKVNAIVSKTAQRVWCFS